MKKGKGLDTKTTSTNLESFIENCLFENSYTFIENIRFDASTILEHPIFSKQYSLGKSIYNTDLSCDFIIFHPQKHNDFLIIDSRWQQSHGTIDEKYPYWVLNIKNVYPYRTIIILDGDGYRKGAEDWLKSQIDDKLIHVFTMRGFLKWINNGGL